MKIAAPSRVHHTDVQKLGAGPADVVPLPCSVREVDKSDGWDPVAVGRSRCDTSLGPAGDRFVAEFLAEHDRRFMGDREARRNPDLATGARLEGEVKA